MKKQKSTTVGSNEQHQATGKTQRKQPPEEAVAIGARIRDARLRCGYSSQEKLAERLNCSYQSVSKWERGESEPGYKNLIKLCDLFDCESDYLLRPDKQKRPQKELQEAEKITGLSYESIELLSRWNTSGSAYVAKVIDALLLYHASLNDDEKRTHNVFALLDSYIHPPVEEDGLRVSTIGRLHKDTASQFSGYDFSIDQLKRDQIINTLKHIRDKGIKSKNKGVPGRKEKDSSENEKRTANPKRKVEMQMTFDGGKSTFMMPYYTAYTEEEMKYLIKEPGNRHIAEDCPDDIREKLQQLLDAENAFLQRVREEQILWTEPQGGK